MIPVHLSVLEEILGHTWMEGDVVGALFQSANPQLKNLPVRLEEELCANSKLLSLSHQQMLVH